MTKRPLVFLVADSPMEQMLRGFFGRDHFHTALGCGRFDFDPDRDIVKAPMKDSHVHHQAVLLLRQYEHTHERAVAMLDAQWDGNQGCADDIRTKISRDLSDAWAEHHVVVFDPEIEVWFWQDNPNVAKALGYKGKDPLRLVLANSGHWPAGQAKPTDPKAAVEYLRRRFRTTTGSGLFRRAFSTVSVKGCTDPAFLSFRNKLATWFPEH